VAEPAPIPAIMLPHDDMTMCEITGDGMTGDGIRHGDHVLVDPRLPVNDGDIAIVHLPGRCLIKHVHRTPNGYRLEASALGNPPVIVGAEAEIFGEVTGVYRKVGGLP
jgi:SOS-response transcriptional repressor LexA